MKHRQQYLPLLCLCTILALLFPGFIAAADTLDQSQPASQSPRTLGDSDYQLAQTFTAGMYGRLDRVSLRLENWSSSPPAGAVLSVSVQTVIDGVPSGIQVGSGSIPLSAIPAYGSGGDWVDIGIQGPLLTPGARYALVLQTNLWNADVNWWYAFQNQYGSSYTGGVSTYNYGSGWNVDDTSDFAFKTYVVPDMQDASQTQSSTSVLTKEVAQIFVPTQSGVIDRVKVVLANGATFTPPYFFVQWYGYGPVNASIQTVRNGVPSGIVLGQGSIPDVYVTSSTEFTSNINNATVVAGTKYALVLEVPGGAGLFWYLTSASGPTAPPSPGGYMLRYFNDSGWQQHLYNGFQTYLAFKTYVVPSIATATPPPPAVITPCSSGVCPVVAATVTPPDSTARVHSNIEFEESPDGSVHGVLNFNDSKHGNFVLQGCTTNSAACRLTVRTLACTDEHAITVAGTYTRKEQDAANYLLNLSGHADGIGTITLTAGDYSYSIARMGLVNVTCPR